MKPPRITTSITWFVVIPSPIGPLALTSGGAGLSAVYIEAQGRSPVRTLLWQEDRSLFEDASRQLAEYFAGRRRVFDVPLEVTRGTAQQRDVWRALLSIPYGETVSYGEVARRVGRPSAARAVAAAIGKNPWSIIVPCHRVVGATGKLTGYGGGLARKRWLLEHEGLRFEGAPHRADPDTRVLESGPVASVTGPQAAAP